MCRSLIERVSTVTSELVQCRVQARVELSRSGIERDVEYVGSFTGLHTPLNKKRKKKKLKKEREEAWCCVWVEKMAGERRKEEEKEKKKLGEK
jgi:hypothetical protein